MPRYRVLIALLALTACTARPQPASTAAPVTRLTLAGPPDRVLGGSLRLSAISDNDAGIERVDFLRAGAVFASDPTAPFQASLALSPADNGPLTLSAVASTAGGSIVSAPLTVTVALDASPPRLSLTSPDISASSRYELAGSVADENGIASLRLSLNGGPGQSLPLAGERFTAVVALAEGSNKLTVSAVDAAGNSATLTQAVLFSPPLPGDRQPPSLSFSLTPTSLRLDGELSLTADAQDEGGIDSVQFLRDGAVIAELHSRPYALTLPVTAVDNGAHDYAARAIDNSGNTTTSQAERVTVSIPALVLQAPTRTPGGYTSVRGQAIDNAPNVVVTVSLDGAAPIRLLLDPTGRFAFTAPLTAGSHTLTFRLSDGEGGGASAVLRLSV